MATEPNFKARAWAIYDRIVELAAPGGEHTNPWFKDGEGTRSFEPDYDTLRLLLGVPLHLRANTQSGVPALALDVWLSYELRRAGFDEDQAWPRPRHPRILPMPIVKLLRELKPRELANESLTALRAEGSRR
jgi:hypothetical protein